MANEYAIKYYNDHRTLSSDDMTSFTMILVNGSKPINITMPKVGDSIKIGRCVNIGQETENTVTVRMATGVSINPADGCVMRRNGSFVTLVYEGNERWRLIGELP